MRITPTNWPLARLFPALFTALFAGVFALLLLAPANAAPVEEDIPQSAPPRHMKARPNASAEVPAEAPSASSATPSDESANPPVRGATDRSDAAAAATTTAPAVHKFFPYTIRSGDTLETIADIFGVQVADITRANRRIADGDLIAGDTIRIPNPFVTRESDLNAEVERLSIDKQEAERKADQATSALASLHTQLETAATSNAHYEHDLHSLPWWRTAAWAAAIAGVVMFGMMIAALIEWWNLRSRYRAVAEMNESLRRLDYRYRMAMARAELRLQQLYGRRRRGFEEGQERPKIPEEVRFVARSIREILAS